MPKTFVSNKDESFRMFENDFMEMFTKVRWYVPLIIYVPLVLYFLVSAFFFKGFNVLFIAGLYAGGFIFWTLTEYFLHRFLFHFHPKSVIGKKIHFLFHGVHHDYPQDSNRLVMPPIVSISLAVIFYFIFKTVFGWYLDPFFAGFITGYLFYDIIHYSIHHFNIRNKFLLKVKAHHMKHHYVEPDLGFGVSSHFWDNVFGTQFKK